MARVERGFEGAGKLAYRIPEAIAATGIGRTTLYALIKSGDLKVRKVRGMTLIPRQELQRLIEGDPS